MQHEDFPGGHPSQYCSRPSTLKCGVLMGSGALVLVWSHPLCLARQNYLTRSPGLFLSPDPHFHTPRSRTAKPPHMHARGLPWSCYRNWETEVQPTGMEKERGGDGTARTAMPTCICLLGGFRGRKKKKMWGGRQCGRKRKKRGATRGLPRRSPILVLLSPKRA